MGFLVTCVPGDVGLSIGEASIGGLSGVELRFVGLRADICTCWTTRDNSKSVETTQQEISWVKTPY